MSTTPDRYTYGPNTFDIPEHGEIVIEECPETITDRLRQAQFDEESANTFIKTQRPLDNRDAIEVVEVTVQGTELQVSAHDVVGRISLTAEAKLNIKPKLPWRSVLDMLLAVYNRGRTVDYHGVPIERFLADDINLEDIFPILATNYLQGIETIHRRGFVRDVVTQRVDLEEPRGRIDVGQTLVNHAEGRLAQHCVVNEIEHDNSVNSLLYYAGTILLQLFREHSEQYDYPAYRHIFSQIQREVDHLEQLGVTSDVRRIPEYRAFLLSDLPKQRHYYERAVDVAKAIISSSIGTPMSGGAQELSIDYVLNMESLFEQYSQVVISSQLERIQEYDALDATTNVSATRSPKVEPFEGETSIYHQPDHAIERGDDTLAVLDSKYYAEGHSPVTDSSARSRLFSYAYLLDTDRLGFLCPLLAPIQRRIVQTGAELQVISPAEEFSLDAYNEAVHEFIHRVLAMEYPTLDVFRAVGENALCLDGVSENALDGIADPDGPFDFDNIRQFTLRVLKRAADELSREVNNRNGLEQSGEWLRDQIRVRCESRSPATTTCVPVFRRENGQELVDLFFVNETSNDVEKEGPLKLL